MTPWGALEQELEAWRAAGRTAAFWWRDDDAAADCAAVERLFALAAASGAPLALAVIPATAEPGLARHLATAPRGSAVLQHGYAHRNHAPAGDKKRELGGRRPPAAIIAELRAGRDRLGEIFGADFLPVQVPPWNRIAPDLVGALPAAGFAGLSTYGPRPRREAAPELVQVNCHIDLFRWKPSRGFLGADRILRDAVTRLAAARAGPAWEIGGDGERGAGAEPIGVMTHHLVHDEDCWRFLADFFDLLCGQAGACILSPRHLWGEAGGD